MAKITGLGGVFLRANDPVALSAWYEKHLGVPCANGFFSFSKEMQKASLTVAFFPRSSDYFPAAQPAMLNFQVDDLGAILDRLAADGVEVEAKREQYDYGKFGWFTDPEGNRVELWEPQN